MLQSPHAEETLASFGMFGQGKPQSGDDVLYYQSLAEHADASDEDAELSPSQTRGRIEPLVVAMLARKYATISLLLMCWAFACFVFGAHLGGSAVNLDKQCAAYTTRFCRLSRTTVNAVALPLPGVGAGVSLTLGGQLR